MVLTSHRRRTAGITALFAAFLLILTAVFIASPASAAELPDPAANPTTITGNPQCSDYGLTELAYFNAPKADGTVNGVTITITDSKDDGATALTWTSTEYVSLVIVKASNEANLYAYDPSVKSGSAVSVAKGDDEFHAISHLSFCEGDEPVEVCPDGTDNAGTPIDEVESCDEVEVCPDGTDNAGTPIDEVEACDEVEVCPDGTDNAGTPIDEVEACDEVEVCPDGTDNAGTPIDEVEACDEVEVCPDGTDNAGTPIDEVEACDDEPEPSVTPTTPDEVEVLPNVIEKPAPEPAPAAQPAAQVAAQELPATGLGSTELLLLALLLMGLGASALLAPDRGREY